MPLLSASHRRLIRRRVLTQCLATLSPGTMKKKKPKKSPKKTPTKSSQISPSKSPAIETSPSLEEAIDLEDTHAVFDAQIGNLAEADAQQPRVDSDLVSDEIVKPTGMTVIDALSDPSSHTEIAIDATSDPSPLSKTVIDTQQSDPSSASQPPLIVITEEGSASHTSSVSVSDKENGTITAAETTTDESQKPVNVDAEVNPLSSQPPPGTKGANEARINEPENTNNLEAVSTQLAENGEVQKKVSSDAPNQSPPLQGEKPRNEEERKTKDPTDDWCARAKGLGKRLSKKGQAFTLPSGEACIKIPNSVIEKNRKSWEPFVLGQFYSDPPSQGTLHNIVNGIWSKQYRDIAVSKMEGFSFLFRIPNAATRTRVINQRLWQIEGQTMFVDKWEPGIEPVKPELTSAPIWLELRKVPFQFFNEDGLERIAGLVGHPKYLHPMTASKTNLEVAKVLTIIDPRKPLPEAVNVQFESGVISRVLVSSPWMLPGAVPLS